ncbi:hypothetical protein BU23DRAFT_640501 [Bimuria novae-zelandiae CBS 107.79]|uniref:Uncharacterized protein n=1 Tax=Bimuria novae-zelandiae CBS 107.79 TaxID=1447943 RepID=A0A6A5VBJ3_9PLEO|nr:hypothetical protein BU23DRAFT_640501 [Bimuria novae-zelandiae CBS 107.79]
MTKPKPLTISAPFDARHVGGVSIPGVTIPIAGIERSSTALEPDTAPSHTFVAQGNIEVPRRSNTIATSLGRPSLNLKTSISRLRGRSDSNSPDRREPKQKVTESPDGHSHGEMLVNSLRKKTSTSRSRQNTNHESPVVEAPREDEEASSNNAPTPPSKDMPILKAQPSISSVRTTKPYTYQALPPPPPPSATRGHLDLPPRAPPKKQPPLVRPKRADSGTAIGFDDVPVDERPLGFREILTVSSFAERMALYKKTRDYWAHADHGLNEWVGKKGARLAFPA